MILKSLKGHPPPNCDWKLKHKLKWYREIFSQATVIPIFLMQDAFSFCWSIFKCKTQFTYIFS